MVAWLSCVDGDGGGMLRVVLVAEPFRPLSFVKDVGICWRIGAGKILGFHAWHASSSIQSFNKHCMDATVNLTLC